MGVQRAGKLGQNPRLRQVQPLVYDPRLHRVFSSEQGDCGG